MNGARFALETGGIEPGSGGLGQTSGKNPGKCIDDEIDGGNNPGKIGGADIDEVPNGVL